MIEPMYGKSYPAVRFSVLTLSFYNFRCNYHFHVLYYNMIVFILLWKKKLFNLFLITYLCTNYMRVYLRKYLSHQKYYVEQLTGILLRNRINLKLINT